MRHGQAVSDADEQIDALPPRALLSSRPRLERAAVDKFGDEVRPPIQIAYIVHGEDVGMIERGEHVGLALQAGEAIGIRHEEWRQDFDRHIASQLGVPSAVHITHPTGAHQFHDVVRADAIGRLQQTADEAIDHRSLGKAPCLFARAQQRLDLGAQSIVAARLLEKGRSRLGGPFERGLKHLLHAIPACRVGPHAPALAGPAVIRR